MIGGFIGYALLFTLVMVLGVVNIAVLAASSVTKEVVQLGLLASSVLSGVMVVMGVLFLRGSPLRAYAWFKRAILVSILLTQVFLFYTQQLGALGELAVNLLVLGALNALIRTKRRDLQHTLLRQTTKSSMEAPP